MSTWPLSEIRSRTRLLSGRLSVAEMSNTDLDSYINKYFQYEFPAEVKLNRNYTTYEFSTAANTREYDFPSGFTNFVPAATVDRLDVDFYQDFDKFLAENPEGVQRFSTWTGDGSTVTFANTYNNNIPILSASVIVDDTVEVFSDDGAGVLTGDQGGSGTVGYTTGAISVTFNTAPTDGQVIQASFIQYTTGLPVSVLMFDNKFRFYPTPDRAYRVQIQAWTLSTVRVQGGSTSAELFVNATDRPLLDEWGPCIALGAARTIVSDHGEMDRYAELSALYKEQVGYILTRTHIDLESTRVLPMW